MPNTSVKLFPSECLVLSNYDFFKFRLAERAVFVVHKQTNPQTAFGTHVCMPAGSQGKELYLVEAKDATFLISGGYIRLTDSTIESCATSHLAFLLCHFLHFDFYFLL